jgi:hypothetical protein
MPDLHGTRLRLASQTGLEYSHTRVSRELMEFDTEEQLVTQLIEAYGTTVGGDWVWMREFSTSCGIADLIGVNLASCPHGIAAKASLGGVPPRWAYALRRLPSTEPFTLDQLAAIANVGISSARAILRVFGESGFCEPAPQSKAWIKTCEPTPVAAKIIAIEAKLRDWRRALYQSVQHADYASACWVVLDQSALPNVHQHADEFEHRGVGLAGLSANGDIEVILSAAENIPRLPYRFWQANAEIARRLM